MVKKIESVKRVQQGRKTPRSKRATIVLADPLVSIYAGDYELSEDLKRLDDRQLTLVARACDTAVGKLVEMVNEYRRSLLPPEPTFDFSAQCSDLLDDDRLLPLTEKYPQIVHMALPITDDMLKLMKKHKGINYAEAYVMVKKKKK